MEPNHEHIDEFREEIFFSKASFYNTTEGKCKLEAKDTTRNKCT
jgi:hypothetical protein